MKKRGLRPWAASPEHRAIVTCSWGVLVRRLEAKQMEAHELGKAIKPREQMVHISDARIAVVVALCGRLENSNTNAFQIQNGLHTARNRRYEKQRMQRCHRKC